MREATLIYPHQLFKNHPALIKGRPVYVVEEPLFLTEFPVHRQKVLLHRLSMQAYEKYLKAEGYQVTYLSCSEVQTTTGVFDRLKNDGVNTVHIVDVTDTWLTARIIAACLAHGLTLKWYESPLFLLPKAEAVDRYRVSKKHMARFYQKLRIDKHILITLTGEPVGGQWSFDADNRQKLPKLIALPDDPKVIEDTEVEEAKKWLTTLKGELYGESEYWIPYTHEAAEAWFRVFLQERFEHFGAYEDALSTTHTVLFHSALSPLLNCGLLTPQYVLDEVLRYAEVHTIPLNSLEGFVRQILGWREFIRAAYECDGGMMRTKNFWQHKRPLPMGFWTGETGLLPVDTAIKTALRYGYNHHIERLMVLGNVMLLSQVHPDQVYRWFMAMYVDAYDWVMVPNVYGMSQFADGGIFATKPYISGSNYIKKMSSYEKGEWEETWTALYWNFIHTHQTFFLRNHRLSMMPRLLEKMDASKKEQFFKMAQKYLQKIK